MAGDAAPLPPEFFAGAEATTTGVTIRAIFRCFNTERDGRLSREQYSRFCQATEGAGCDETRWAQHCKALGVQDPSEGMPIGHFGKLYTQNRFKKHFGKGRSDLEKVKEFLAAPAPAAPGIGKDARTRNAASEQGGQGDAEIKAPRAPSRRGVLRVGASSRLRTVAFTAPGLLGIQWRPATTLKPPDAVSEVLGESQAAATSAGRKDADKSAIASRGDLHPNAARHGQLAGATPPPRGFAAFEPSPAFEGARPGYQFQVGSMGLGYYWYGGAAGQAAAEAAKRAHRGSDSESSDEDEDETEYGCVIDGLKPGSYAETLAKDDGGAAAALQAGMLLKRVNDWPTDGMSLPTPAFCAHTRRIDRLHRTFSE